MTSASTSKVTALADAVALIPEGARVAVGGETIHRVPVAAVYELLRQRKPIELVKTSGSYDVDLLVGAGLVRRVQAGYVGFETLGMAPRFRHAVESGQVQFVEHT